MRKLYGNIAHKYAGFVLKLYEIVNIVLNFVDICCSSVYLLHWIQLTDISHRKAADFPILRTDTMKGVARNSTTCNMTPSDIVESGAQAIYFSDANTNQC